jgi:chaperone BCS1
MTQAAVVPQDAVKEVVAAIGVPIGSLASLVDDLLPTKSPMATQIIVCFVIPILVAILSSYQRAATQKLSSLIARLRHETIRHVDYVASTDYYFNLKADNRNNILQKAVTLYLADRKKETYRNGLLNLMEPTEKEQSWEDKMNQTNRCSEDLRKLRLAVLPPMSVWERLDDGIYFMHYEEEQDGASLAEKRTLFRFSFKCHSRDGAQRIQRLLERCQEQYVRILKQHEDRGRYLFQMQLGMKPKSDESDEGAAPPALFKKYKLSDDKTFDSLFFPEKQEVLQLIDNFRHKRGKFAIEGFPQKLGILLHGPPGTGKTSFVKALSTLTGRHIVSVPLGKITTNQELYDIMFERLFPCIGDDGVAQQLGFEEVIFLMEEIDAATDIVKTRKTRPNQESTIVRADTEKFEKELEDCSTPTREGTGHAALGDDLARESTAAGFDVIGPVNPEKWEPLFPVADKLDLAGLLNVLDGVVDSPNRIVIMTTNHPERLDSALIRPGRINTKLYMGFMQEPEMCEMLELHYGALSTGDRQLLHSIIVAKKAEGELMDGVPSFDIAPAEVEQICSECETFADFCGMLRRFPELPQGFDY